MTLFYPWPEGDGVILYGLRLIFGSGMFLSIFLGVDAIRRRDFARHGDWMLRAYAIGMGAGTQALTLMGGEMIVGKPSEFSRAVLMGAAWVINLAVAEWVIRRRLARISLGVPAEHPPLLPLCNVGLKETVDPAAQGFVLRLEPMAQIYAQL